MSKCDQLHGVIISCDQEYQCGFAIRAIQALKCGQAPVAIQVTGTSRCLQIPRQTQTDFSLMACGHLERRVKRLPEPIKRCLLLCHMTATLLEHAPARQAMRAIWKWLLPFRAVPMCHF